MNFKKVTIKPLHFMYLLMTRDINVWNNYSCDIFMYYLQQFSFSILNNCDMDNMIKYLDDIIIDIISRITTRQRVTIKLMNKCYDSELSNMNRMKYVLYVIC